MATQIEIDGRPYRLDTGDPEMEANLYEKLNLLQDGIMAAEEVLEYGDADEYDYYDEGDEDDEDMDDEEEYEDSADHIDALEAELAVAYAIINQDSDDEDMDDEDDEEYDDEEMMDAADFEDAVNERVAAVFEAYQDAKDLLPPDFNFDGISHPGHIKQSVLEYFDSGIESKINFDSMDAVEAAYQTLRKHRRDSVASHSPIADALSSRSDMMGMGAKPARKKMRKLTYSAE